MARGYPPTRCRKGGFWMNDKEKDFTNIDNFNEQKINIVYNINNTPTVRLAHIPEIKPLDKVKDIPLQKRYRELER